MLELRLFGPPHVLLDGVGLRFDTRKAVALLALLGASGREHGRDAIAALLWPELDRSRARAVLRRTLSVATAAGPALRITAGGVELDPEQTRCDVREFQRLAGADDAASWTRAVELSAEDFLEGFGLRDSPAFESWQLATADGLRGQLSQTLRRLVRHSVARGELPKALDHARHRTRIDPLSEPAHADLIRVTAWTGDRPGALAAYRSLVRLLTAELGVPPLPETLALHEAIRGDRLPPPTASDTASARDRRAAEREPSPPVAPDPLVGRDAELALLGRVWRSAADRGRCAGLLGEPGIGKTAILRVVSARVLATGAPALQIAGHLAERPLAHAATGDLVRAMLQLRPGLVGELGPDGTPLAVVVREFDSAGATAIRNPGDLQRVHEAALSAVAACAAGRQLLITVDDAHLLDEPSSALLAYLVRRLPPGVLLLATWAAGSEDGPLPDAITGAGEVLRVAPLGRDDVAALIAHTELDPSEVLRRTRGVPLLVSEYALSGGAASTGDSASAREVVAARYGAASNITRQVVAAAAVVGTLADPELLRVASGRDEAEVVDAIEEAVERGLLVERTDRPGYDLPHDLVRDAALARLSLARLRLLHGRVADVLARRHAVNPLITPAGAVAGHLAAAGRDEDAGAWYAAAAEESLRLFAHADALVQLQTALALGQRGPEVHSAIGAALIRLGRYRDALVSLDQAGALAEGDPDRQAELEHSMAGVHDRLGNWELAQAHLEAARDLTRKLPRHAQVLADLALVLHRRGESAAAQTVADAAAAEARTAHDDAALTQADNVLGVLAAAAGDADGARAQLTRAIERARSLDDLDLLIAALNNLSRAQQLAGDDDEALVSAREALALADRQGDRHRLAALHSHLADLLHAAGRDDEALLELTSSATAFAEVHGSDARPEVWTLTEW